MRGLWYDMNARTLIWNEHAVWVRALSDYSMVCRTVHMRGLWLMNRSALFSKRTKAPGREYKRSSAARGSEKVSPQFSTRARAVYVRTP